MKKIAAITMVRNDAFFVRKWITYYGAQLGRENLYVFFDGEDQLVPPGCEGVNIQLVPHIEGKVAKADRGRIAFVNEQTKQLFERYDIVIGTDIDEFLVVDPQLGRTLPEFLSSLEGIKGCCVSGLGVDVGQDVVREGPLDPERPILTQRQAARLSTRYTKSSVLLRPAEWGSGFHRVRKKNFHIIKDLYLFHFGSADLDRIKERMASAELVKAGWSAHLDRRAGTIRLVSSHKARKWSVLVPIARAMQTLVRPPYAWNKPAMFGLKLIVRIPDRFRQIV